MSFLPTKQQLEELGFKEDLQENYLYLYVLNQKYDSVEIRYYNSINSFYLYSSDDFDFCLYPESIDDIKTLIKMLTTPNN